MFLLEVHFWDVVGDCIQIVMCLLILLFYFRSRKRKIGQPPGRASKTTANSFNDQVYTRAVQQQIEQAFTNIMENIAIERESLKRLLEDDNIKKAETGISRMNPISRMSHNSLSIQKPDEIAEGDQRDADIRKFSLKGMSAKKISDELKIPLGEVELILSLQKE